MDYDWLSTNDFAGEAVAPLSDFCWPGRPNASAAGKSVQPAILHLSRSKPSGTYSSRMYQALCFTLTLYWLLGRPEGVGHGFPITSPIQNEKPFNLEIFVSAVGITLICLLYPSRKANHEDAGRSHRRQGGSGVCPQAEGDWEVNGGGVRAVSQCCLCWCFLTTSCDNVLLYRYDVCDIYNFFQCYRLFSNYTKMKREKKGNQWSLSLFFSLGDEHPVTVQPYAVSLKQYFRIQWIVDPKRY